MMRATEIKAATDRKIKAMRRRPKIAQGTARTTVTLRPGGTACEIEDGPWRMLADLDTESGCEGAAPDAGVLGRGALGACMVLGYELWAARLGVRIDDVRVTIETDYDALGMYALDDSVSPGWLAVRCTIEVTSSDDPARVAEAIEQSHRYSPLMADISRPVPLTCDIRISAPVEG
jgi:uncharacterized OsmC-like protein